MSSPSNLKIYGSLLLVQVIFGFHYLTTSIIVEEVDPFEWTGIRILFAGLIMYSLYSKRITNFPKGNEWYFLIFLSLLGIVLNTAFFTKGLELTTPAHASLISCMIPVITFIFAWFLGREGLNIYKSISLIVALCGALILMEIDNLDVSSDLFIGDVFIFINFICFGLFLVLSKPLIEKHSPFGLSVIVMSIGAVILLPISINGLWNNWESWLQLPWWIYFAAFYSIFFANYIHVITPKMNKVIKDLHDNGIKCGIALFGETIFSLVPKDKKQKALEILKKYDDGVIITSRIDNSGARLE